jgi:inner membrane protein
MGFLIFCLFILLIFGGGALALVIKYAPNIKPWYDKVKVQPTFRLGMLFVLLISLSIPLLIVDNLVNERMNRYKSVLREIGQEWGAPQRIMGPFLVVPYQYQVTHREQVKDSSGETREVKRVETVQTQAIFLPDGLKIKAMLTPEYRYRSIYQSLVYTAKLSVDGAFPTLSFDRFPNVPKLIHWDKSYLSFGLSDTRAIKRQITLKWGDQNYDFASGPELSFIESGIHAPLELSSAKGASPVNFSMQLNFNGSQRFEWSPVGRENEVMVTSPWPSPSFQGRFLPETREISETGFSALWRVPNLARPYPQQWQDGTQNHNHHLHKSYGAVHLFEPVHIYTKISRAVKYGFLFIGLTLLALLLIESASRLLLRAVHYGLSVSAMVIFYLLILSMSEHWGFNLSYLVASAIVTVTVGVYHWSVFQRARVAGFTSGVMVALYLTLFFILQLQDFALLMGTSLLLLVLWIVMYQTRGVRADSMVDSDDSSKEVLSAKSSS